MKGPHIKNEIRDAERGITFEIWAYRKLSYEEMTRLAGETMAQMGPRKRKALKRGQSIRIDTIFGHERPEP